MSEQASTGRIHRILSRRDRDLYAALLRTGAALAEPFYTAAVRWRNRRYEIGRAAVHHVPLPVVSVGNLTAGGTGKTPVVAHLAELLQSHGHQPAVLMRGYRAGRTGGSDEQRLLASRLPEVPILAEPDRVAAAEAVDRDHPRVNVLLLDDGFQHRRLGRDLDLVLLDATNPFGYDHVLPRGLLREPPEALERADGVLITHAERITDDAEAHRLRDRVERHHGAPPLAWLAHEWETLLDADDRPVEQPTDRRAFAFCGLGNPAPFFAEAKRWVTLTDQRALADHHAYRRRDVNELHRRAEQSGAEALLTSEKDWVKLRPVLESVNFPLPVWRPRLTVRPTAGGDRLAKLVTGVAAGAATAPAAAEQA